MAIFHHTRTIGTDPTSWRKVRSPISGSDPNPSQFISSSKNKFVHLALQNTFSLAVEIKGVDAIREALSQALDITIVGDNDFYSQRAKVSLRTSQRICNS